MENITINRVGKRTTKERVMARSTGTVEEREARIAAYEAPILARVAAIRREAARWHWVVESWHNASIPAFMRKDGPPERYWMPKTMFLEDVRDALYQGEDNRHRLGYIYRPKY